MIVHKIKLTHEMVVGINSNKFNSFWDMEAAGAFLATSTKGFSGYREHFFQFYTPVSEVDAVTLEEAFEKSYKLGIPISVGDIVEVGKGFYFCDNNGWKDIKSVDIKAAIASLEATLPYADGQAYYRDKARIAELKESLK